MTTDIEWTDETWNVTRGCRRVSAGCENCYAERQAGRFSGEGMPYDGLVKLVKRDVRQFKIVGGEPTGEFRTVTRTERRWTGKGRFVAEKLTEPLHWKTPKRIFVDSMSDLFFEEFTNEQIAAVFGVMYLSEQHTHQVLTKRPKRMREWFAWLRELSRERGVSVHTVIVDALMLFIRDERDVALVRNAPRTNLGHWPLPNVWLGVSVENQVAADERIPELLQTPAAVRFLSCEPLLGPVDLTLRGSRIKDWDEDWKYDTLAGDEWANPHAEPEPGSSPKLDWVIVGCESGPGARECDVNWIRSIVAQCTAAGTAVFVKQAVGTHHDSVESRGLGAVEADAGSSRKAGGVIGLPYIDGKQYVEFPKAHHRSTR